MVWVLTITIPLRLFILTPDKNISKLMNKKSSQFYSQCFCLSGLKYVKGLAQPIHLLSGCSSVVECLTLDQGFVGSKLTGSMALR